MAVIDTITPQILLQSGLLTGQIGDDEANDDGATEDGVSNDTSEGTPSVQIILSDDAQDFLGEDDAFVRPGKSADSTAHRARAELAMDEFAALRDLPFGQIVSTLARNGDLTSLLPEPEPGIGETSETGETGETGEAGIVALSTGVATDEPADDDPAPTTEPAPLIEPLAAPPEVEVEAEPETSTPEFLDSAGLALAILQDTVDFIEADEEGADSDAPTI